MFYSSQLSDTFTKADFIRFYGDDLIRRNSITQDFEQMLFIAGEGI